MKTTLNLTIIILLLAGSNLSAATHYVSPGSTNPTPPYANWATAATNIQQAVNAAVAGDTVVVTNGVYPGGVVVTNSLALLSVNGPQFTVINGGGTNQCASLTNGASLTGFTLTNGFDNIGNGGGGVWCASTNAFLTNCLIAGNSAGNSGGGAEGGTLYNCMLTDNSAFGGGGGNGCTLNNCALAGNSGVYGGGASVSTLNGCTLIGNGASYGGGADGSTLNSCLVVSNVVNATGAGAFDSTLNNCTVWGNTAMDGASGIEGCSAYNCIIFSDNEWGNYAWSTLNYCCTTPLPDGFGNITNAPLFIDDINGNFHLQSNSPCINSGDNAYVTNSTDLDGNPRIVSGTVDIGAYEYQGTGSVISYAWLQQYGLPTDGSADFIDSDHDGMNNWQEYLADTSPIDANDYLHITSFTRSGTYNTLWWTSKSTRLYQVQRRAALDASSPWETIITNAAPGWNNVGFDNMGPQYFYRIGVVQP